MMLPVAVAAQRVDTDRLRANAITVSGYTHDGEVLGAALGQGSS
ncbi:MAG TPA: hypothetical protein VMM17_10920 [Gemmatimonadaceae bacterium]|nr:hypothetical protein [Gemmatimonadaceae bacterium]